jgi:hypothetical protein
VPRPRLRGLLDWTADETAYRAELTEYVPVPPVTSGTPVLARDAALPDAWWADLRIALETLATVPTDREAVRQRWIDNNFRRFLGIDPIQIHACTTGHGDLHWANLTHAPLVLLDWENWGRLPVGYDLGLLHACSLTAPATAARIRHQFAHGDPGCPVGPGCLWVPTKPGRERAGVQPPKLGLTRAAVRTLHAAHRNLVPQVIGVPLRPYALLPRR